jgi:hypothetical protein
MPTRKLYIQASFEQGMIDTVSFDYEYEDYDLKFQLPQNRGALLIENYDPSIVRGALTKRYGYGYVRSVDWNIDAGLVRSVGVPAGFTQNAVLNVDIDRYTLLIDRDPLPNGSSNDDKVTFLGATAVPYNKPIGQNVIVFFIRDIIGYGTTNQERTLVVHYATHIDNPALVEPRWRNAHIDGLNTTGSIRTTPQPSVYPGWNIRGTYTDHSRHGGNLVITTDVAVDLAPNNVGTFNYSQNWVKDEMFPCYVWTYWDLRRKRDDGRKFWNIQGTDPFSDLVPPYGSDKYSQFKVMIPSMSVARQSLVSSRSYRTSSVITADPFDPAAGSFYFDPSISTVLTHVPQAAVEIVIIEFKGRAYSVTPPSYPWAKNFVAPEKLTTSAVWPYLKEYGTHIQSIEVLSDMNLSNDGTGRWNVLYRNDKGFGRIEVTNVEIMRGEQYRDGKIIAINTKETKVQNAEIHSDEQSISGKSFYWVVGVQLPNYIESNNPRPWMKDEKIPWVCTFKIRGAEVIAGKGVHVVDAPLAPAYPSMYWIQSNWAQRGGTTGSLLGHEDVSSYYDWAYQLHATSDGALKQQFALYKTQTTKLNGSNYLVAINSGYTWRTTGMPIVVPSEHMWMPSITVNGPAISTVDHEWYPYPDYVPYCYEPFNPTSGPSFVANPGQYQFDTNFNANYTDDKIWVFNYSIDLAQRYLPIAPTAPAGTPYWDGNKPGYRRNHTEPNLIYFTIKVKASEVGRLVDLGIEAINIYVAEPGDESQFRSVGLQNISDPLPGIYMKPATTEFEDYTKYRLIKSHVLDGNGEPLYNATTGSVDVNKWKDNYTGAPVATNAWLALPDGFGGVASYISVGQNIDKSVPPTIDCNLTPDFLLWDYPATSTPLQLNSSGKYWQGIGARCVTNIKGRTFLGGCIDKYGEEEQAIIRYSDIQSGVISLDIFSEENYLKVGGMPHTAITEYREQLWTFSRHECHRIQMPTIGDVATWEYLDKIPGQGTFSPKTVVTTPDGVFWCNESGVWLSDGRMPSNIAEPVLTYYKAMATDNPPYYATQISLPRFPYNDEGYNPYLEVSYDESRNELVVSSPAMSFTTVGDMGQVPNAQTPEQEYRLIYSFSSKTWRVEYIDLPTFGQPINVFDKTGTREFF